MPRLTRDARLLLTTPFVRLFAYGGLSTVLLLHLTSIGMSELLAGFLLTAALLGDTAVSLALTTVADRLGRRRVLLVGAILMAAAGLVFAFTQSTALLLVAAIVGIISPSGSEVGPFIAVEQAALSELTNGPARTSLLAWYNLTGSIGTALGSMAAGLGVAWLGARGVLASEAYRHVIVGYAAAGLLLAVLIGFLGRAIEPAPRPESERRILGLHRSRSVVFRLSALFALDAFGGGFVLQAVVAYWFHVRHGVGPATIGSVFFGANLLAGASALLAARLSSRIGLINTMVFTHIPSNLLLMLVPLMPGPGLAIAVLLARFAISQMDVPTRQAYTMAVVEPDERSAAAGVTGVARTTGAALAPALVGPLLATPALAGAPFFVAGVLKITYDLLLYRAFRKNRSPEEGA